MLGPARPTLTAELADRLAGITLSCIGREYPNQIAHPMRGDADAGTPRSLHPAFFGSYDWHSAVHGHWCLARLLRNEEAPALWGSLALRAMESGLSAGNLRAEREYLAAAGRETFERPYGLAWVLALDAELRLLGIAAARLWAASLGPLATLCAERLGLWATSLTHPVRTGVHSQSAFAMSLALDWARATGQSEYADLLAAQSRRLYAGDKGWPLAFEPSGEDFLSPSLAEADLMRRVMPAPEFAAWLSMFLPQLDEAGAGALAPVRPRDATDGRLAHLDGLCLSRAWMLEGIAGALPAPDGRAPRLLALAELHLAAGLERVDADDYARAHWIATFAVYALTHDRAG